MRARLPGELTILPPPLQAGAADAPSPSGVQLENLRAITGRVLAAELTAAFESRDRRRHECAIEALLELVTPSKNGS